MKDDKLDTSFQVPSFGFPDEIKDGTVEASSSNLRDYLNIIADYDKKIEGMSKEISTLRFENERMKTALSLISSYVESLN